MKGEVIDSRIVPGVLITLRQRMKYIPTETRNSPDFDIEKTSIPVWTKDLDGRSSPYDSIPSGSIATVINRYVKNEVTKLEVLVNGTACHCYGTHADLVE